MWEKYFLLASYYYFNYAIIFFFSCSFYLFFSYLFTCCFFCFMLHHHIIWLTALRCKLPHFRNNNTNYSHYCVQVHTVHATWTLLYIYSRIDFRLYVLVTFCTSYYCCMEFRMRDRTRKWKNFIHFVFVLVICYLLLVYDDDDDDNNKRLCPIQNFMLYREYIWPGDDDKTLHGRQTNAFASRKSKWNI